MKTCISLKSNRFVLYIPWENVRVLPGRGMLLARLAFPSAGLTCLFLEPFSSTPYEAPPSTTSTATSPLIQTLYSFFIPRMYVTLNLGSLIIFLSVFSPSQHVDYTSWRVAEHDIPKYASLVYWLFWAIGIEKQQTQGLTFFELPLFASISSKRNSVVMYLLPGNFINSCRKRGDYKATPHPDRLCHKWS